MNQKSGSKGQVEKWLNNRWTHPRDTVGDFGYRAALHILLGVLIGLFLLDKDLFLEYEANEDLRTADEAWKDIAGTLVGFPIGRTIAYAVIVALVAWLIS